MEKLSNRIQAFLQLNTYAGSAGSEMKTFLCAGKEKITAMKAEDSRCLTLHVITDPGQSSSVSTSFQYLVGRLDPSLDVIYVSERFKPLKTRENHDDKVRLFLQTPNSLSV